MEAFKRREAEKQARPFRFEDLTGPEPSSWALSIPRQPARQWKNGAPPGAGASSRPMKSYPTGAPCTRGSINSTRPRKPPERCRDRADWASGKAKDSDGFAIVARYKLAMSQKRSAGQ
jgi:hypothetical protein